MGADVNTAASVSAPTDVYARPVSGTTELIELPADLQNCWITIAAETLDVFVRFGTEAKAAVVADEDIDSVLTGDIPAVALNQGWRIKAGTKQDFDNRIVNATHFAHISTGTARIEFYRSSGK